MASAPSALGCTRVTTLAATTKTFNHLVDHTVEVSRYAMLKALGSYSGLACPKCSATAPPPTDTDFDEFFKGKPWTCIGCGAEESFLTMLTSAIKSENSLTPAAVGAGFASSAFGQLSILSDAPHQVHLGELGVPEGATLLQVHFSPLADENGDGCVPLIATQHLSREPLQHSLTLFGMTAGPRGAQEPTLVTLNVLCTWLHLAQVKESDALIDAVEAYCLGHYRRSILSSGVAVETELYDTLWQHFIQFGTKERVRSFLTDGATFGYQISPLLASLMKSAGAPPLSENIALRLKKIHKLRNKVAHGFDEVSRDDAGQALIGAIFSHRYLQLYGPDLRPRQPSDE